MQTFQGGDLILLPDAVKLFRLPGVVAIATVLALREIVLTAVEVRYILSYSCIYHYHSICKNLQYSQIWPVIRCPVIKVLLFSIWIRLHIGTVV